MTIYTQKDWDRDNIFNAEPGQEISEDIYFKMLNALPPKNLPRETAQAALEVFNIPVHTGFLMGEPHSSNINGLLYLAFGMNDYGKGKHYYYLGLSSAEPELNGNYYFFDCLNALLTDRYFKESAFESEQEAILTAANYEATLYKYTYEDGERTARSVLYDPFGVFEEG